MARYTVCGLNGVHGVLEVEAPNKSGAMIEAVKSLRESTTPIYVDEFVTVYNSDGEPCWSIDNMDYLVLFLRENGVKVRMETILVCE